MKQGPPGLWIYLHTLCTSDLDVYEQAVLLSLLTFKTRAGCFPAQESIAQRARINIKTCKKALKGLKEKRWISWKPRYIEGVMQTSNAYEFMDKTKAWIAYQDGVSYVVQKRTTRSPKYGPRGMSSKNGPLD